MSNYYDRQGNPMELMEWAQAFEDMQAKIVGKTTIGDADVSTVWLGVDHNFLGNGPPLIFETMIFGGDHSGLQWRYSTEEEALAGHNRVVEDLQEGREPENED